MKNLIYLLLPALLLIITSCGEKVVTKDGTTEFLYQKELTVQDADGNSANITVHANSEDILNDYTEEAFTLETTTQIFPKSENLLSSETAEESTTFEEEFDDNEVFVMVTNYDMDPSITGFSVRYKFDNILSDGINPRATTSFTSYGSSGTKGAYAAYTGQTCSAEYLNVKLKKKNSAISFWKTLCSTTLYSVGDNWSCSSSTSYYKYKLKFISKNSCGGTIGIWYYWLT